MPPLGQEKAVGGGGGTVRRKERDMKGNSEAGWWRGGCGCCVGNKEMLVA